MTTIQKVKTHTKQTKTLLKEFFQMTCCHLSADPSVLYITMIALPLKFVTLVFWKGGMQDKSHVYKISTKQNYNNLDMMPQVCMVVTIVTSQQYWDINEFLTCFLTPHKSFFRMSKMLSSSHSSWPSLVPEALILPEQLVTNEWTGINGFKKHLHQRQEMPFTIGK